VRAPYFLHIRLNLLVTRGRGRHTPGTAPAWSRGTTQPLTRNGIFREARCGFSRGKGAGAVPLPFLLLPSSCVYPPPSLRIP
jgi:hypothetical protein